MSTKLNSIISDGMLNINTDIDISFQTTFSANAPHCNADPVTADDLTNKAYVDSRLVNSNSGTNLYFNYSVADAISPYRQLGISIVITTQTTINTPQAGTQSIASFITDSGYPGTTSIPSGIWELNQFGRQVGGNTGDLRYFFTLTQRDLAGVETLLGTSGYSADINTSVTDIFFSQLPLGILTLLSTDRLIVKIFSLGTGTGVGATLDSQFQDATYSYITSPLVSGSNFLSLNNTFTGVNSFTNATTNIGSLVVSTNALNSNNISTDVLIGDNLIGPSILAPGGRLRLGQNMIWGEISIARRVGRLGETHIHDGTGSGGSVYIGSTSTSINIAVATSANGPIYIGSGVSSTGAFSLGSATRLMTILGNSLSTFSTGIITLLQTPTAYPTGGNTVPTVSWVTDAFTYLKANINTWALAQTFTTVPINNGTIGLGSANDTNVPTTAWVQTALTYFKTQAQTWDLAQTFTAQPLTNATIPAFPLFDTGLVSSTWVKNAINYAEKGKITSASTPALAVTGTLTFANTYTVAPLVLLTVDMGSGTVIVSCALAGSASPLLNFNYILSSLTGVSSLNYYVIVL